MKLGLSVFILCLLATASLAVVSDNQTQSGRSADDYHESTDVIRTHSTNSSSSTKDRYSNGTIRADDNITKVEVIDGNATVVSTITELQTIILPNGTLKNITVTRTVTEKKTQILTTVERFWSKKVNLHSAREVALEFASVHGTEMTQTDIDLINTLTYTDGVKFHSEYEYQQVKTSILDDALPHVLMVFRSAMTQATVDSLKQAIRRCDNGVVVYTPDTHEISHFRMDGWLVFAEVLIATCGKDIPEVQLFAFSANKHGNFKVGLLNPTNIETVRAIMTRFLFREIHMMFNCPDSPVKETFMKKRSDEKLKKTKERSVTENSDESSGNSLVSDDDSSENSIENSKNGKNENSNSNYRSKEKSSSKQGSGNEKSNKSNMNKKPNSKFNSSKERSNGSVSKEWSDMSDQDSEGEESSDQGRVSQSDSQKLRSKELTSNEKGSSNSTHTGRGKKTENSGKHQQRDGEQSEKEGLNSRLL